MASVRFRNGKYYYRATIKDANGKTHWIEHGSFSTYEEAYNAGNFAYPRQRKSFICTRHLADIIFERFPESHPAHIPLKLIYLYGLTPKEVYSLKVSDINLKDRIMKVGTRIIALTNGTINLLSRHIERILNTRMTFLTNDSGYLNVYFPSCKPVLIYQMDYISKVIRKTIHPYWNWRDFRISQEKHTS